MIDFFSSHVSLSACMMVTNGRIDGTGAENDTTEDTAGGAVGGTV